MRRRGFLCISKLLTPIGGCKAHAQSTVFGEIKAFNANRRVPRRFLDPGNSILRSMLVYDATCMGRRGFLRILYFLSQFEEYLGGFPSR